MRRGSVHLLLPRLGVIEEGFGSPRPIKGSTVILLSFGRALSLPRTVGDLQTYACAVPLDPVAGSCGGRDDVRVSVASTLAAGYGVESGLTGDVTVVN